MALAQSLADLAAAVPRPTSPAAVLQIKAGCRALGSCSMLARALTEPSAATAFKLASACSLAFGPGTAILIQSDVGAMLESCMDQINAVGMVVSSSSPLARQPQAAAAYAASTGRPAALLPWLRAVSHALTTAQAYIPADGRGA